MHFGLSLPNGGLHHDPRQLAQFARLAEDSGWEALFLEDYIVWQGHPDVPTYDPWVTLAAMAVATERIRLGTMITALPRRRPWKLAKELVTLDHLSNGRAMLGVGLGDTTLDQSSTQLGEVTDDKVRAEMVDESLAILTGFWTGQPFSFHGKHYDIGGITLLPPPVQVPRIPIWVGGIYPRRGPMLRAARWDGACLYKESGEDFTPEEMVHLKTFIDKHRAASGPFDIASGGRHRADDWDKERTLVRALGEAGMTWWIEYAPPDIGGLEQTREYIKRGPLE